MKNKDFAWKKWRQNKNGHVLNKRMTQKLPKYHFRKGTIE